jgi:RNA polymerase-interacting CarD/CdnL/TRCF family regulator
MRTRVKAAIWCNLKGQSTVSTATAVEAVEAASRDLVHVVSSMVRELHRAQKQKEVPVVNGAAYMQAVDAFNKSLQGLVKAYEEAIRQAEEADSGGAA